MSTWLEIDHALTALARRTGTDQYVVWQDRSATSRDLTVYVVKRLDREESRRVEVTAEELCDALDPLFLCTERIEAAVRELEAATSGTRVQANG